MTKQELQDAKLYLRAATSARQYAERDWHEAILEALEEGASQKEVGKHAGVSQQRIAQIVGEDRST